MKSRRVADSRIGARIRVCLALTSTLILLNPTPAHAASTLAQVQAQVRALQEDAAAAAEQAQQAQVEFNKLSKQLASVQQQAAQQSGNLDSLKKTLGAIAADQYKSGGMSQSMELLFSSDPKLYLAAAGSLESITKKKSLQLRKYAVAKQRLTATSLTVNDKISLAAKAKARYVAQLASANAKLQQAQTILDKLSKAERERLAALVNGQEDADQKASAALAASANLGSGRGATALRFAIKQIGDRYVFGAAGPTLWDCSGLTMRAFGAAGVSLPHSAASQMSRGKKIGFASLKPGDLVFFNHGGNSYVSHVGIYLGGGRMVHAPHTGARVKVTDFGTSFGRLRFAGGRRI
jgi:cell wall-associated NlpC family hydrolase